MLKKPETPQITKMQKQAANTPAFRGSLFFLSNLPDAGRLLGVPGHPGLSGVTVEHAYQASKAASWEVAECIATAPTPHDAKRLGKWVGEPPDFDHAAVMYGLLVQKFSPGSELAARLVKTYGIPLAERNDWGDIYWGVYRGRGKNMLGKLLMKIRTDLVANNYDHSSIP